MLQQAQCNAKAKVLNDGSIEHLTDRLRPNRSPKSKSQSKAKSAPAIENIGIMRSEFGLFVLVLVAASCMFNLTVATSCIDENGNPVDWFIGYKFPRLRREKYPFNSGWSYAYITSENVKQADPISAYSISESADVKTVQFLNRFKQLLTKYLGYLNPFQRQAPAKKAPKKQSGIDLYWTISAKLLTDPNSILMRSLSPAYNKNNDYARKQFRREQDKSVNSIFYNDQPPVREGENETMNSASRAHAKGLILIDDDSGDGIWVTHSIPQFPPARNSNLEVFDNAKQYGQTFMCLNFDAGRSGKQIVEHLINMFPTVYDSQISRKLLNLLPELHELAVEGERRKKRSVQKLAQVITTRQGQDMYIFSKSAQFGDDLYSGWIDEELNTALFVETWRKGNGNPLDSFCPKNGHQVNNVQDLKVVEGDINVKWSYTKDHSKWAISETNDPGVVCITDINRMESQFKRGGGAVCIKNPSCWSVFSKTIADLEPCPKAPKTQGMISKNSDKSPVPSAEELIKKLSQLILQ